MLDIEKSFYAFRGISIWWIYDTRRYVHASPAIVLVSSFITTGYFQICARSTRGDTITVTDCSYQKLSLYRLPSHTLLVLKIFRTTIHFKFNAARRFKGYRRCFCYAAYRQCNKSICISSRHYFAAFHSRNALRDISRDSLPKTSHLHTAQNAFI